MFKFGVDRDIAILDSFLICQHLNIDRINRRDADGAEKAKESIVYHLGLLDEIDI